MDKSAMVTEPVTNVTKKRPTIPAVPAKKAGPDSIVLAKKTMSLVRTKSPELFV